MTDPDFSGWLGIDLEATGVTPEKDRIIEVGISHFEPIGNRMQISKLDYLINPEIPIPKEVSEANQNGEPPGRT